MSKKCCCNSIVIPGCYRCKKSDGRRYRSLNDFDWTVTPQGVANGSTESIYDMCMRYRELLYPGGPYPPLPICLDEPFLCDTAPCTDFNKAYSVSNWEIQGPGTWREPWWPDCDENLATGLFDYEEACFRGLGLLANRDGSPDSCVLMSVGIWWMRKADASVTIGASVEMIGPSAEFDVPRIGAAGHLDLSDDDGLIECDGFDEVIPLTSVYGRFSGNAICPPDDAGRCTLPSGLRLQGVL